MLIELFELACNSALEHDLSANQELEKLRGKTLVFRLSDLNQSIVIQPTVTGLEFSREVPEQADVTLSASISAMLKIARAGMQDAELEPGELDIQGDPILGQRFAQFVSQLDINWETLLAEHLGETPANFISTAAKVAQQVFVSTKQQGQEHISQLIHHELAITAQADEVEDFLDEVDSLRAQTDLLEVRLKKLVSST